MAKPTIKSLTADLEAANTEIAALKEGTVIPELEAQQATAVESYTTAVAEHAEDIEGLKADHVTAQEAQAAEHAKAIEAQAADHAAERQSWQEAFDTKPSAPVTERIGSLQISTGIFIIGDCAVFDQKWKKPQNTRSAYVVDIKGPHAEQLAHRQKNLTTEQLCDGTWRIHVPDGQRGGLNLGNGARKLIAQNEWPDTVSVEPSQGFTQRAIDASRADGCGLVAVEQAVAYAAIVATKAEVHVVKDDAGNATAVHLIVS